MKFVRPCLIASTLCALSACSSSSSVHVPLFTKRPVRQDAPGPVSPTPATPVVAPAPAAEPVVTAAPVIEPAPAIPTPVVSADATPAPAPMPAPAATPAPVSAPEVGIKATRTGRLVQLSWMLPVNEAGYRAIEVMRNTSEAAKGRTRVKTLRSTVTQFDDTVESASERYWYWLKLTDQNNTVVNLGPVEAVETTR